MKGNSFGYGKPVMLGGSAFTSVTQDMITVSKRGFQLEVWKQTAVWPTGQIWLACGLIFATVLTMVILPVFYSIVFSVSMDE